jgi:hypothetical protein
VRRDWHPDPLADLPTATARRRGAPVTPAKHHFATEPLLLVHWKSALIPEWNRQTGGNSESENQRIIQELDRDVPHSLDEDFTWKRPYGFILLGRGTTGITTWKRLFELFCLQLLARDRDRFRSLVKHPEFVSKRGHHSFSHTRVPLRSALQLDTDLFTEINLSANSIRDTIRRMLVILEIPIADLKVFLREDRDSRDEQ